MTASVFPQLVSLEAPCYQRLLGIRQAHVFQYWDQLDEQNKKNFLQQLEALDCEQIENLWEGSHSLCKPPSISLDDMRPPCVLRHPKHGGDPMRRVFAYEEGRRAIKAGRVGVVTVAGGQGTRLNHLGPKGTFPVTPFSKKSLFQVFAEKILAVKQDYGVEIPWFIMTSPVNHEQTQTFFAKQAYFGLEKDQVFFFQQGLLPALDFHGRLMLESPSSIVLTPDGHGGIFQALLKEGMFARMAEFGVEMLSYFQVDNPLAPVLDPIFVGFHLLEGSEFSSKTVLKENAEEKVGLFIEKKGQLTILEYSDAPKDLLALEEEDGQPVFSAANVAIHMMNVEFAKRIAATQLPYHRAHKKIKALNAQGELYEPLEPNGIKFESFIFDALPLAKQTLLLEVLREEEFSPIKNATGVDSPLTAQEAQMKLWRSWLKSVGLEFPEDYPLEISPLWADSQAAFCKRYSNMQDPLILADKLFLEGTIEG